MVLSCTICSAHNRRTKMTQLREYTFPNGDLLILDEVATYAGLHGLTVYTVYYAEDTGGDFHAIGSQPFMSKEEADESFDKRLTSEEPSKPSRKHGGIHEIVLDSFSRYLGEHNLRREPLPTDWAAFFTRVKETTISRDKYYYDGNKVHDVIDGLNTVSGKHSDGRADLMVELPAWKVLEMLTAITALAMALGQHPSQPMRQAA